MKQIDTIYNLTVMLLIIRVCSPHGIILNSYLVQLTSSTLHRTHESNDKILEKSPIS